MADDLEQSFYQTMHDDPDDVSPWYGLHDWLLEGGDPRVDFARLQLHLRGVPAGDRAEVQRRVRELIEQGLRPCLPVLTNSIGMELALLPAGTFLMGSPQDEGGRSDDEGPQHEVQISRPFYLGVYQVTQAQWQAVMGNHPSWFCASGHGANRVKGMDTSDFPVEQVSWDDVTAFLKNLSALDKEAQAGRKYRLATEAEWEYSCRGGASSYQTFHFGTSLSSTQANFAGNSPYGGGGKGPYLERTCKVGSYQPNAFGLYDMHGNVWEWCSDWYAADYYTKSPRRDPPGASVGTSRVFRGGSCYDFGQSCRSAYRLGDEPAFRGNNIGFRVASGQCRASNASSRPDHNASSRRCASSQSTQ